MSDRIAAYEIEVRLLRWGDSSTAGRTITLELDPDAGVTHPFKHYTSGAKHGQRFRLLFAPIGDDDALVPVTSEAEAPARSKNEAASERAKANFAALPDMKKDVVKAAMLVKDEMFQGWMLGDNGYSFVRPEFRSNATDNMLKAKLGITSKSEIGESREVNERWHTLLTTFLQDTNQLAEVRG